jgi:branched-chain amino acid transport system substrate-binding protein
MTKLKQGDNKMKKTALVLVLSIVLLAFSGCGGAAEESTTIKIGTIAPTTGQVAVYGQAVDQAVRLAVKNMNAAGGLLEKEIELIGYDNKGDITESVNAFNRLVGNDGIDVFIGAVISSTTLTIAPLAVESGIPMISATATNLEITPIGDNIFRACFIDPYQGVVMAQFAAEELKAKRVGILFNTADDYSTGLADSFKAEFEAAGGTITNFEGYTGGSDKDFKSILTKVKAEAPDVLFLPDYYNTVSLLAEQAKELGIEATLIGGDGWDGVLGVTDEAVEGAYYASHFAKDDPAENVQKFIAEFEAEVGEMPNSFSALGYDAAMIMMEAVQNAGSTDSAAVVEALKGTDYEGITGHIQFDADGNPVKSISIIRVKDGVDTLYGKFDAK